MSNDKVFAGFFEPLKKWNDSSKKYEELDLTKVSLVGKFNFTLNELEDIKKYASTPKDADKPRRVYFELKTSKKGSLYAEVSDPNTWGNKQGASSNAGSPQAAFGGNDGLPF
jgi:hypothetical protein|tara:strand:+ start:423 stop:758 length:336 start_codon:yes stop_codon:yes gene_type:complete